MPTSWTNRTVPTTSWSDDREYHFLLQETFDFLLLETGDKIRLNQFGPKETEWTPRTLPA